MSLNAQKSPPLVDLLVEIRDGTAILTIDRPEYRNALGLDLAASLLRTFDALERDQSVRAIILTGQGEGFCAGAQLGSLINPDGMDHEEQLHVVREFNRVAQRMRELDLPIIGAINGAAVGGGAALALSCDIAIASEKANYYFAFGRVGAAACDMACTYLLPRIVGTMTAQYWFMTGATVGAEEGRKHGLFIDVVSPDQLLDRALEIAKRIQVATPRRAAAISKQAVLRGQDSDFQSSLTYETYLQSYLFTTDEHRTRLGKLMTSLGQR
jgi:enoyl-CoA hydratase/carnithine racemase